MSATPLAEDTRSRLLDAASEIFAESGFQRATVREICARAGVNIALVNYHFGDKLELYTEVLRRSIGASQTGMQKALEVTGPPETVLREMIRVMLDRILTGGGKPASHFQLMVHELVQPSPAFPVVVNETARPVYDRFRTVIGSILGLPMDDDRTRLATHSIVGQIVHYSHGRNMIAHLWPELEMTPERIVQIADHIADYSLAGLKEIAGGKEK